MSLLRLRRAQLYFWVAVGVWVAACAGAALSLFWRPTVAPLLQRGTTMVRPPHLRESTNESDAAIPRFVARFINECFHFEGGELVKGGEGDEDAWTTPQFEACMTRFVREGAARRGLRQAFLNSRDVVITLRNGGIYDVALSFEPVFALRQPDEGLFIVQARAVASLFSVRGSSSNTVVAQAIVKRDPISPEGFTIESLQTENRQF